jgi:prepilin-type N-terminal cleavage/methylation domain-containing protein
MPAVSIPSRGFTLAELAIAMVIVALLLASALWPLSTQMEMRAISDTQRTMDEIREAIIGFALANGRLPCPAYGAIPAGQTFTKLYTPNTGGSATIAAGAEQYEPYPPAGAGSPRCMDVTSSAGATNGIAYGVVPWATLGVKEADSWGRRFGYRVSPAFTDAVSASSWATTTTTATVPSSPANQSPTCNPPTSPAMPVPTLATFALCTLGDIAVFNPTITTKAPPAAEASGVPVVIVSYGKNGFGAYQPNGVTVAGTTSSHEAVNVAGTSPAPPAPTTATPTGSYLSYVFYSRERSPDASGCSDTTANVPFCEFDDIVTWISSSTLVARMVSAGRLP